MKKIGCLILCFLFLFSAIGCQKTVEIECYKVPNPIAYPDYTFSDTPDPMDLRLTAVRAMRDLLSVQWCTEREITYKKNGPVSGKQFLHEPETTYAGVLYSSASSGLFQFLEYYNTETGALEYEGSADELKLLLGSSCADALLWAWSTVCNSVSAGFYPVMMVPANGYYPVGEYMIRDNISSFNEYPSNAIINNTPKEVMLAAYASMLPADALISTPKNHAMMVIEHSVVVYTPDGSIDLINSYVMIQDQRGGQNNTSFYEVVEDGVTLHFSGRTSAKITFQKLYEDGYIPLTCAEFMGTKPYEKASVSVSEQANTIDGLCNITINANYPLAVINLIITDAKGNKTVADSTFFNGSAIEGVPRTYQLSKMEGIAKLPQSADATPGNTISIEVVVATGERFTPISFTI